MIRTNSPGPARSFRLVLSILLLLAACSQEQQEGRSDAALPEQARITVASAEETDPIRQVEVMGTVEAADSASIAARISGNIIELPVKLGSRVEAQQLLAALDAGEITAQLLQAKAQYDQAVRNLKREEGLLQKKAATPETVKTLKEQVRIAEAAYKEAKTMLGYTKILAPFAGVITDKTANVGDLATPGKPLLKLESENRLQVIADVPESLVLNIALNDSLPLYIPAAAASLEGTVVEIAPTADPTSRTAPVKLAIEPGRHVRPGQFARVYLHLSRGRTVMIPEQAVLRYGQMDRVFLIEDDIAKLQLVKTGLSRDGRVEILAGLRGGDRIAVAGHEHLRDGQPVSVTAP